MLVESDHCEEPSGSWGWEILSSHSRKLDDTSDLMAWYIGNHGFQMTLSPRIPAFIEAQLHDPIAEWLAGEQLAVSDIRAWAVHPRVTYCGSTGICPPQPCSLSSNVAIFRQPRAITS
jgi:predicted naringenin-chalcone synthase